MKQRLACPTLQALARRRFWKSTYSWGRLGGSDMERNPLHASMNEWCQIGKGGAPNRQRMLDCGNRECLWIVM
ncbi:hypothetical protein WN943_008691 [Citrus x changshan-huyou]